MSDGADVDSEQIIDELRSQLSIPESGTVQRYIGVSVPPTANEPAVSIQTGVPLHLAEKILNEAEDRVDLRRRGKVGKAIIDLDDETWELKIEGDSK